MKEGTRRGEEEAGARIIDLGKGSQLWELEDLRLAAAASHAHSGRREV